MMILKYQPVFTEETEPALNNFDSSPYSLSKLFEPDSDNMKRSKESSPSAYKELLKRWTPSKVRALSNDQIIEKAQKSPESTFQSNSF